MERIPITKENWKEVYAAILESYEKRDYETTLYYARGFLKLEGMLPVKRQNVYILAQSAEHQRMNFKAAAKWGRQGLDEYPNLHALRACLGVVLYDRGLANEGRAEVRKALEDAKAQGLDAHQASIFHSAAEASLRELEPARAYELASRTLAMGIKGHSLDDTLGNALMRLGRLDEATEFGRKACVASPNSPINLLNLARTLILKGDLHESVPILAMAEKLPTALGTCECQSHLAWLRDPEKRAEAVKVLPAPPENFPMLLEFVGIAYVKGIEIRPARFPEDFGLVFKKGIYLDEKGRLGEFTVGEDPLPPLPLFLSGRVGAVVES